MDFNQLLVFQNVYLTKNFSAAAKNLYLTQPTVSAHINQLEKELNTKLFKRTTKKVIATEAGDLLFEYANELINRKNEIVNIFISKYGSYETIHFGSSTIPTNYIMPTYMKSFAKLFPHVRYEQQIGDSYQIIESIEKGKFNIGFVGAKKNTPKIDFIPFYIDYLVFVTPNTPEYFKIIRNKNPIQNLLKCPIILRNSSSGTRKKGDYFLSGLGYKESDLNVIAKINDQEEIYKKVSSGEGISLFSKIAAKAYKDENKILVYNPVSFPMRRNLYIASTKQHKLSDIEKEFINFIKKS